MSEDFGGNMANELNLGGDAIRGNMEGGGLKIDGPQNEVFPHTNNTNQPSFGGGLG
jgi:hypothetical protein